MCVPRAPYACWLWLPSCWQDSLRQHRWSCDRLVCACGDLQALQKVQGATRQDQEAARRHLAAAAVELEAVRASAHPDPGSCSGFSPDVNRRLMAPVPPRSIAVGCCLSCGLPFYSTTDGDLNTRSQRHTSGCMHRQPSTNSPR